MSLPLITPALTIAMDVSFGEVLGLPKGIAAVSQGIQRVGVVCFGTVHIGWIVIPLVKPGFAPTAWCGPPRGCRFPPRRRPDQANTREYGFRESVIAGLHHLNIVQPCDRMNDIA